MKLLNWARKKAFNPSLGAKKVGATSYLQFLRTAPSEDIGAILAVATGQRKFLEARYGVSLLDPGSIQKDSKIICRDMRFFAANLSDDSNAGAEIGIWLWIFTLESSQDLEMRPMGRAIWREIQRGFPHVLIKAQEMDLLSGRVLLQNSVAIGDYNVIPKGLESP
ncbi:MAG: hypothetical protein WCJ64_00325 [Rhodospirillaceae bacterium]